LMRVIFSTFFKVEKIKFLKGEKITLKKSLETTVQSKLLV